MATSAKKAPKSGRTTKPPARRAGAGPRGLVKEVPVDGPPPVIDIASSPVEGVLNPTPSVDDPLDALLAGQLRSPNGDQVPQGMPCSHAFLIVVLENGDSFATGEIQTPVVPQRQANLNDMHRACTDVIKEINQSQIAQRVAAEVINVAAARQQAIQNPPVEQ